MLTNFLADRLVLAELLIGEMQIAKLIPEARDLAGRSLLVGHHGLDQAVEIDVLDVESLAHVIAAGPQNFEDLRLSCTGSNCVLTASGWVITRLSARAVANTLTRMASMYQGTFRTTAQHINNTKRQFDGYGFFTADVKYFVTPARGIYLAPSMR